MLPQKKGQESPVKSKVPIKKDGELRLQLKKYDVLNENVLSTLQESLTYFREGNFGSIDEELLSGEIGGYLIEDKNFSKTRLGNVDDYDYKAKIFEDYKSGCFKILDGLQRGLELNEKNTGLRLRVDRCDKILKDRESMIKYYRETFGGINLFGDEINTELTEVPLVKKEIVIYMNRHGFPEGGIFDNELLAGIIKELKDSGEYE